MKHLTMKFREIFAGYEYNSKDINILNQLLDIVMSIMTVIDKEDVDYIQKLASFLKIFSSDFSVEILDEKVNCLDILDEKIIDIIYENQILPIFVYFDQKYEYLDKTEEDNDVSLYYDTDANELCGNNSEMIDNIVKFDREDEVMYSVKKIIDEVCPTTIEEIEANNRGDPYYEDDSKLFDVLKLTRDVLQSIYDELILLGRCDNKNKTICEISDIYNAAKVTIYHPYKEINELSKIICSLCKLLTNLVKNDTAPSLTSRSVINLLLESAKNIKYDFINH